MSPKIPQSLKDRLPIHNCTDYLLATNSRALNEAFFYKLFTMEDNIMEIGGLVRLQWELWEKKTCFN